jgi:hypothetical protein
LTIVTELATISGMERERFSGAARKRGTIFVPYDLRNNLRNLCSLLKLENNKDNQNGQISLVTGSRRNHKL